MHYECHIDTLFAMFWHKEPDIKYYMCTINKIVAKPGQCVYFQVHYTEKNMLDYIDPNNDTLMLRLANGRLRAECRIMVGTDKRATITTNWSEFRRRATFAKETYALLVSGSLQSAAWFSPCTASNAPSKTPQLLCQYNLALSTRNYALSCDEPMVYFWTLLSDAFEDAQSMSFLMHYSQSDGSC